MELTDLRYFLNVATTGSFSQGARLSHVSPPAISKAVAKLEAELGVRLFTRTTRRVTLTAAGEILRLRSREIFDRVQGLRSDLEELETSIGGELRIGAMEVFSIYLLPGALARLAREHPRVVPSNHELHPRQMVRLLLEGRLDVGFTIGASSTTPGIDCHLIGRSRGVLVCGREHRLFRGGRLRAADLPNHSFVAPRMLNLEHVPALDQFPEEKYPRKIGATIELLQMGLQLAINGAYLGFFPEICVREHVKSGTLRVLSGIPFGVSFDLVAMTVGGLPLKRAARVLIAEVTRLVEEHAATKKSGRRASMAGSSR